MPTSFETFQIGAADGHEIAAYRWRAKGDPRGIVQISHGMAEHAARYDHVAGALNAEGWSVYAHDHRGHGRSAARESDLGHFADRDGWASVLSDLRAVRKRAREETPDVPVVLLGHSMGSFIALSDTTAAPGDIAALVLSASSNGGGALQRAGMVIARLEKLRLGVRGKSSVLALMSFGSFNKPFEPARTPFDWLSRDPAQVDLYIDDPRCGFRCTTQLWIDLLGALVDLGDRATLRRIPSDLPVYVIAGALDPVSAQTKGLELLMRQLGESGVRKIDHRFYPAARHELFNETNRAEVISDLAAWLDRVR